MVVIAPVEVLTLTKVSVLPPTSNAMREACAA
jgi:hypothetical protein